MNKNYNNTNITIILMMPMLQHYNTPCRQVLTVAPGGGKIVRRGGVHFLRIRHKLMGVSTSFFDISRYLGERLGFDWGVLLRKSRGFVYARIRRLGRNWAKIWEEIQPNLDLTVTCLKTDPDPPLS